MSHNEENNQKPEHEQIDASAGYETSDVRVTGILVFMTGLSVFVVVAAVFSFAMGKVINWQLAKVDGPPNKWSHTVDTKGLGGLPTNPALQQRFAEQTNRFPTPRVQVDDGNQDIAELHEREDLLLDHYTWVDQTKGSVRIPIDVAMELIAARGLPVAPAAEAASLMAGDKKPAVRAPLTNGFVRTGYEQELAAKAEAAGSTAGKE